MRNKIKLPLLIGLMVFTAFCAAISTFSWFVSAISFPEIKLSGKSSGAYFAYGDGSASQPFGITTQRHLYNLAWLQYNGTFNQDALNNETWQPVQGGDGTIDQYYFKIDESLIENGLDMTGWILPPIGTETHPFLGNFDGNGVEIKNVTVSNQEEFVKTSDFRFGKKPSRIDYNTQDNPRPEVVGFFGVVGSLEAEPDYTYDSEINSFHDFTLTNITVESKTSHTLIGLAAGYVNGKMENVLVDSTSDKASKIDVSSQSSTALTDIDGVTKLSHYGLVGYTTNTAYGGHQTKDITQYFNSDLDTDGDDALWGGSVDMKNVFNRVKQMKTDGTNENLDFYTNTNILDGDREDVIDSQATRTRPVKHFTGNSGSDYRGNFLYETYDSSKYYVTGGSYNTDYLYATSSFYGRYITDGNNNYLNASLGNKNTNDTTTLDASYLWEYVTISGDNKYIRNYNDSTSTWTYLRNNNGTLATVTTTSNNTPNTATSWTVTSSGNNLTIVNNNYRLICYQGTWAIKTTSSPQTIVTGFTIRSASNANHWLRITNGTTIGDATTAGNATTFKTDGNGYVYYDYNGTNYYLVSTPSNTNNSNRNLSVSTNYDTTTNNTNAKPFTTTGNSGSVTIKTTVYIRSGYNREYYVYLRYNNGWTGTSTYNNSYTVYATQVSSSINFSTYYLSNNLSSTPINSVYDTGDTDGPYMKFNSSNTSYFPLTVYEPESDEVVKEGKTAYYPKKDKNNGNTGYIVSAATGPEENSTKDTSNRFRYLRSSTFAEYGQTGSGNSNGKIANSITSTGSGTSRKVTIDDSKVKTINQSGNVVTINKSDYVKYDSSKGKLENTLSGTDYVYGLHFTNEGKLGYVSMDNILKSKNVCIMDKEYTEGYELPVYCIDFNLKEKGYINFFAGSYNGSGAPGTGVDCFFSLNRIFRDPDNPKTIVDIKEIQKIYVNKSNDDWSCAYKYTDGTYSRPYRIAYIEDEEKNMMFDLDNTDLHPDPNDAIEELNNLTATQFNNYINNYNYVEEFDTARLGDHDAIGSSSNGTSGFAGYIFYFEFPVNYGEYCLGNSRTGSEGAYLIYLDIGANGSEIKDKLYAYNIIVTQENVLYPLGVDFAAAGVTGSGGDTFCIYIESEDQGIVSFTFNDDKDDINITDASSITEYSYLSIGGYCTLSGNSPGGGLVVNPDKTYTRTCYIHTDPIDPNDPNSASHDIRIVDTLEKVTNGNVTTYTVVSTVYYVDDVETTEVNLYNAVPSLGARGMLALIRDRLIVISLELTNAKGVYDLDIVLEDLPWKDDQNNILTESPTTYKLTYTEENADFIITITSPDGLTIAVKVNGTQVNSGSTYHYTAPSNNP